MSLISLDRRMRGGGDTCVYLPRTLFEKRRITLGNNVSLEV